MMIGVHYENMNQKLFLRLDLTLVGLLGACVVSEFLRIGFTGRLDRHSLSKQFFIFCSCSIRADAIRPSRSNSGAGQGCNGSKASPLRHSFCIYCGIDVSVFSSSLNRSKEHPSGSAKRSNKSRLFSQKEYSSENIGKQLQLFGRPFEKPQGKNMREDSVDVEQEPAVADLFGAVNKRILLEVERVQTRMEPQIDPLAELFEEGMDEFVNYEKERPENYVTRAQKTKAKLEKLARDMNDPVLRRMRNKERRKAEKIKISNYLDTLDKEGVRKFLDQRKAKKNALKEKVKLAAKHGQSVFIDLVYEKMMNPKENKSLAKQIELITIAIKYLDHPPAVHLCSLGGVVQAQLQRMSYLNLQLCPHTSNVLQVAKTLGKKLVYLSPDAELPLESVEDDTAYIIGGLVDRSIIKHASQMRARDLCVEARHLPIRDFMKSRTCLNLDHVVMMICKFKDCGDWKTAFEYAAPKRWKKQSKIEGNASQGSHCSEDSGEEEFNDKIK